MARARSDAPSFKMTIENGRLLPATAFDQERLLSWRNGTLVDVSLGAVDRRRIRQWWAVLGLCVKQCRTPWATAEQASEAVKLALGIVQLGKTVSGKWMQWPRSLTELDDLDLEDAVRRMIDLMSQVTGVDVATLRKEAGQNSPEEAVPTLAQSGEAGNGQEPSSPPAIANQGADGIPTPLPSAPLDEGQWLKDLARVLIASIGPKAEVIENSAKGMAPPGLSKATADTAKQIAKLAARACNDYGGKDRLDRDLAIRSIANISGLERRPG
jgi:hypothetical protein